MSEEQAYAYWLYGIPKIGSVTAKKLVRHFTGCKEIYQAGEKELFGVLRKDQLAEVLSARGQDVKKAYEGLKQREISFYPYFHEAYPARLKNIADSPFGLFVKGGLPEKHKKSVAIVGARECSEYGRYVAEAFGRELAKAGIQIISGMARGIDGIAQKAAVNAGGKTFGVLGCGVDICYPPEHRVLYKEVCETGGMLSAYLPGTRPESKLFPPRNRIISGLSDAVLVIEAGQKSGTLITVDMALEQGREVYVVPGRITDRLSDGCNCLLSQGAGVALSPAQLLRELSENLWQEKVQRSAEKGKCNAGEALFGTLTEQEKAILGLLDFNPIPLDELRKKMRENPLLSSLTLQNTMEMVVELMAKGLIKAEGGYYGLSGTGKTAADFCSISPLKKK